MTLMNARLLAQQRRVNVGVVERTLKDVLAQRLLLGGGDNEEGRGLQLKRVTHSWAASNPHVMDQARDFHSRRTFCCCGGGGGGGIKRSSLFFFVHAVDKARDSV